MKRCTMGSCRDEATDHLVSADGEEVDVCARHGRIGRGERGGPMTWAVPCSEFVDVKPGESYPAYCRRCSFSRAAHEHWDEWTEAAQITERSSAAAVVPREEI